MGKRGHMTDLIRLNALDAMALDAYEYCNSPFKLVLRVLYAERRPLPGAVMLLGADSLEEVDAILAAGVQGTTDTFSEPDLLLEVIVLDRNFDKLPNLCWVKAVQELEG